MQIHEYLGLWDRLLDLGKTIHKWQFTPNRDIQDLEIGCHKWTERHAVIRKVGVCILPLDRVTLDDLNFPNFSRRLLLSEVVILHTPPVLNKELNFGEYFTSTTELNTILQGYKINESIEVASPPRSGLCTKLYRDIYIRWTGNGLTSTQSLESLVPAEVEKRKFDINVCPLLSSGVMVHRLRGFVECINALV